MNEFERLWNEWTKNPTCKFTEMVLELLIVCWEPPPISRIHRHRLCIKLDCSESAELYCFNTFAAETPTNRECVFNFIVGAFIPSFVSLACHGSMRFYQSEISVLVLLMFRYEQCLWKCFFSVCIVLILANADNVLLNEYLDHSMSKFKHSTKKNILFSHLRSDNTDMNIFLDKIRTIEFIDWNFDFKSHINFSHTKHSTYLWIHHIKQIE